MKPWGVFLFVIGVIFAVAFELLLAFAVAML